MKYTVILLVTALLVLPVGSAWAQGKPDKGKGVPVRGAVQAKNPNSHEVQKQLRQRIKQTQMDLKAGKITKAQAKTRRDNLNSVHRQASKFRRQNAGKDLTDAQRDQLKANLGGDAGSK
jgi:Flp pilus assembly protein TadB